MSKILLGVTVLLALGGCQNAMQGLGDGLSTIKAPTATYPVVTEPPRVTTSCRTYSVGSTIYTDCN